MKNNKALLLAACLFFTSLSVQAQQFLGYRSYSPTISNVLYQPSLMATTQDKLSVTIASASFGLWNNAYYIRKDYLLSDASEIGVEGEDFYKDGSAKDKDGYLNIDFIGPSVSYALDGGHHVGLYTRFREIVSVRGIDNQVFQVFNNIDESFFNTPLQQDDLRLNVHSFSEVGLNYSRKVYLMDEHSLYAGLSVKYLMGAAAGSLKVAHLNVNLADIETVNQLNGQIMVAYSDNVATLGDAVTAGLSNIGRKTGKGSLGMDIGATYVLKEQAEKTAYPYMFRVSVAVTDIGSISYTPSAKSKTYTFNADSTRLDDINRNQGETLSGYIGRMEKTGYISQAEDISDFKVKLPTAFRLNADWNVLSRFFLNTNLLLNLLSDKKHGAGYLNTVAVTMRYEGKWYSAGLPLSLNALGDINFGIALRGGPFFIGSSSLFSSLFSKTVSTGDAYAGLSWSF